jgi:hypothetical protein
LKSSPREEGGRRRKKRKKGKKGKKGKKEN